MDDSGILASGMELETQPARSANPAAFHFGPAHVIVHGNSAFLEAFGAGCVGQPAREALVSLPSEAFLLMDAVYRDGKSLATRIRTSDGPKRLVIAARRDPETGATYGVASHIRPVRPEPAT
jgi:hypothetical protein